MSDKWLKSLSLTCWCEFTTQESILERFTRDDLECKYIVIGAIEKTADEKEHFHVLISLERSIRFDSLKRKLHSSIHIEPLRRFANYYAYLSKEGIYYSNVDFVDNENLNTDIYTNIINEIQLGSTFKELVKNHPKFALLHYDSLLKVFQTLNNGIDS